MKLIKKHIDCRESVLLLQIKRGESKIIVYFYSFCYLVQLSLLVIVVGCDINTFIILMIIEKGIITIDNNNGIHQCYPRN